MPITPLPITKFVPTADKLILDVRDLENYQQGHILHAKNCPIDDSDDETLRAMVADSAEVFVLCGGGTKAGRACDRLAQLNPNLNIVHLVGGTRAAKTLGWTLVVGDDVC